MAKKKRISTLWFTVPLLGVLYPPFGVVVLIGFTLFVLLVIANIIEMLCRGELKEPNPDSPSTEP